MTKLNVIKEALSDVAKVCNILEDDLSIDYSLNLDEELHSELEKLAKISLVLRKALDEKDMVAVQAALIMSRIYSMNLRNFFNDVMMILRFLVGLIVIAGQKSLRAIEYLNIIITRRNNIKIPAT